MPRKRTPHSRLYHRRQALGISQSQMASRLGIHRSTVSQLENFRMIPVDQRLIGAIAGELGMSREEVVVHFARGFRRAA